MQLHAAGSHTIADLAELFRVSRPTVYRVLEPNDLACGW
ncbi:helix-turn-helix domain-containing protein [Kribbella sp. NPDC050124]